MEGLVKRRKQARRLFSLSANRLVDAISTKDCGEAAVLFEHLKSKYEALREVDNTIFTKCSEVEEDEMERDLDETEEYNLRWLRVKNQYQQFAEQSSDREDFVSQTSSKKHGSPHHNLKLPKLELIKFDGEVKNWLRFWTQFKKIHEDDAIECDDKLSYLLQAMEVGSSARQLVETFPPTGQNYEKAVEQLKQRFARDEVIIEYYIRELLELIMRQVKSGPGKSLPLRFLYDSLMTQIQGLESLNVAQDRYAAFLYPMVESALPEDVLRTWNRSRPREVDISKSPLSDLMSFLRLEVESEERIALARSGFDKGSNGRAAELPSTACFTISEKSSASKLSTKHDNTLDRTRLCIWCEMSSHTSSECNKAQRMTLDERKDFLKNKRACYTCLKIGHNASKCRFHPKCLICSRKHFTLMCNGSDVQKRSVSTNDSTSSHEICASQPAVLSQSISSQRKSTVLLQTLQVNILHNNKVTSVRALIDSGAQRSFISKEVVNKLNIKPNGTEEIQHSLFGGVITRRESHKTFEVHIMNKSGTYGQVIGVLEQATICNHLPKLKRESVIAESLISKGIYLSDLNDRDTNIDILIGSDVYGTLLTGHVVPINGNLVAVETKLGWTVQGPVPIESCLTINNFVNSFHSTTFDITDLWKLETLGMKDPTDKDQLKNSEAWSFFENTIRINEENRYEVKLPWLIAAETLDSNYDNAFKRLHSTTSRLSKLGILKDYGEVFEEWRESGIIEEVIDADVSKGYYLPHHAVVKESSLTTKIRPVFDASSSKKGESSLNSCLDRGVNLIELIPPLIVKFRKEAIGVTADIRKAFLQISLYLEDRDYLKFLWWRDLEGKELVTFRHRRVVFGVTTSPFHLAATILHHLDKYDNQTAEILRQYFYVDNCVLSLKDKGSVDIFMSEAKAIMMEGNFDLRCWVSGPEMVDDDVKTTSVLGLNWDPRSDTLFCKEPSMMPTKITKRSIMSIAHAIFDPIGFTCPVTLVPKMLIQECWTAKFDWDVELPDKLKIRAMEWINQLNCLNQCGIPRRLSCLSLDRSDISLHVFGDASKAAYAGCVFLRTELNGTVSVQLILAKCRVSPVSPTLTMPRLELQAAVLSTRLAAQAKSALGLESCKEYYWTDSSIVLAWLTKAGLCVYVHNRVKEIKERTNVKDWYHVSSCNNPADLPSRGCNADALLRSQWWKGPEWLYRSAPEWPITKAEPIESEVDKETVTQNFCVTSNEPFSARLVYSKFSKTVRVVAWCLRWLANTRRKDSRCFGNLTVDEIERSEIKIFKLIQREYFVDLDNLKVDLNVAKDINELLRIKTRLTLSEDNDNFITPILLPSRHAIVRLLVSGEHIKSLHAGAQTLINVLREHYWILGVRRLVKSVIHSCVICRRHSSRACTVPQAPLPADRIRCGNAFDITGVDFAGPLFLKSGEKCWVVLFTCATYRAVHLELCTSLSTEDFLLALRRFVARRGNVSIIWSDNGTNFRGANNLLEAIDWQVVSEKATVHKIKWRFNPPRAPWWGGFWERLIGLLKELVRRVLGKAAVFRTEMETLLCECESILNSRPLTYLTQDSEGVQALTPSMFLANNAPPTLHHVNALDQMLTGRLRYIQKLKDDFKTRFRNEYLGLLVYARPRKANCVRVGDIVLIEGGAKRIHWPLALVLELIEGVDGTTRVARLKTSHGELVRPLQRLFPLEIHSSSEGPSINPVQASDNVQHTRCGRPVRIPSRFNL